MRGIMKALCFEKFGGPEVLISCDVAAQNKNRVTRSSGSRRSYPCSGRRCGAPTDSGKLEVAVNTVVPLSEARRAHALSQAGHVRGKIVLQVYSSYYR
jgi:NADPH:quinone reductase-like Zn-dependent oxidoreductase